MTLRPQWFRGGQREGLGRRGRAALSRGPDSAWGSGDSPQPGRRSSQCAWGGTPEWDEHPRGRDSPARGRSRKEWAGQGTSLRGQGEGESAEPTAGASTPRAMKPPGLQRRVR